MKCPCNSECTDCVPGFQKVIDLKNAGLVIYRRTTKTKDVNQKTANVEYAVDTTEDIYILHNTKDTDISSADYWPEIGHNTIKCPRCRKIIEHAQNLLKKGPTVSGNNVTGICDNCKIKDKPCFECRQVVKKFVPVKPDDTDMNKEKVKHWLTKIECLLQDITKKKRARSDTHIDQICHDRQRSVRKFDVENLFEPLELDLAVTSQRQSKPENKILASKHIATPVGKEESFVSFEHIFKDISGTQVRGKTRSTITQSDEIINFKQTEIQHSPKVKALLRKYNSAETLHIKLHDTTKQNQNRIIFPTQQSKKLTKQKSSSEFIKDTKDKLTRAKEEKKLKEVLSEKTGQQSDEKETARKNSEKAKDYEEFSVDGNQNVRQKGKYSVKSNDKDAFKAEKEVHKTRNNFQKSGVYEDVQKADKGDYKSEKEVQKTRKHAEIAVKDSYKSENDVQKSPKDAQKPEKDGYKSEKGAQKGKKLEKDDFAHEKDAQKAEDGYKSDKGYQKAPKDAQNADKGGYKSDKSAKKFTKNAQVAEKDAHKFEKGAQKTPKDNLKDEKDDYTSEKGAKKSTKDPQIAEKDAHKGEKGAQKTAKDAQKAGRGSTSEKGGEEHTKDAQIAEKNAHKIEKRAQTRLTDAQKAKNDADMVPLKLIKDSQEEKKHTQKAQLRGRKADDLENEKQVGLKLNQTNLQKTQALEKKTKAELPSSEIEKIKDHKVKLETEKEKAEDKKKIKREKLKSDPRLGKKPIMKDLIDIKSVKMDKGMSAADDLILKLVQIKQSKWDGDRERNIPIESIIDMRLPARPGQESQVPKHHIMMIPQSESSLSWTDDSEIDEIKEPETNEIIIREKIRKIRPLKLKDVSEVMPSLPKSFSGYDSSRIDKQEITQTPDETSTPKTKEPIKPLVKEKQETVASTETPRTNEAIKRRPFLSPASFAAGSTGKGFVRYTLSDRKFIDNGWTLLPTEKVVRKLNVYRMRPAHPEFDWFEHNKNNRLMKYDTGEKLAEIDDNGRGRWFYRNGRMALDYYDAEELNAGQRFVIYSNGEPDERGRSRPYTLLATFDYAGNGIVFDHGGKIRLKYNQTEGVVLDRSIGPVSHWKWHTLNDPPVLQQVMIDTQMAHKDPVIMKYGGSSEKQPKKDNEDMLAIEFDNFIKEKSKKLSQSFKPFQIKMKALKINEHFSLRVLDQATVYLLYRDGTTNLKLNIGMVLDQKEIVDTDTAEVGEVSNSFEKLPARTESLAGLQKSVAHAQHYYWQRKERERKMRFAEPSASVDKLVAGTSRPLRPVFSQTSPLTAAEQCKCSRKPTTTNVYYDTRFY